MNNNIEKEKIFRFPKRLDTINWARFVMKLLGLGYKNYGIKQWSITEERIADHFFYRSELSFERETPLQHSLRHHMFYSDSITVLVEPFSENPKDLDLKEIYKCLPEVTILVSCRQDFTDEYYSKIIVNNNDSNILLIPLDTHQIMEANKYARKGDSQQFDDVLVTSMHAVLPEEF